MLLYDLPAQYQYKIIFMRRKISEIIASQKKMLARKNKQTTPAEDAEVAELFEQHLTTIQRWLAEQTNISVIYPWYHEILANSQENITQINQFFDNKLDAVAMSKVVDQALYRNKIN
jgi:hypothetical protein